MITIIKGAEVYAPNALGKVDVAFCGNKVIAIQDSLTSEKQEFGALPVTVVDASGKILIPGLIDPLVHISGGGGEGGFHTRTPEMQLTEATLAGVTSVVGALGTDDVSRTLEDLVAKAEALENEGLNTFCHTGSYQVPVVTLTGSVRKDIMYIPKFIGVGELAIADHRSSHASVEELTRIAADVRVAGMLSGKKGVVFLHLGDHASQLDLVHQVVNESAIPASQFYATHINRSANLLEAGIHFAKNGGYIDMTTSTNDQILAQGEVAAAQAVVEALRDGCPLTQVTMSSDGNASLPVFDSNGSLLGLEVGRVQSLFAAYRDLVLKHQLDVARATQIVTLNPAIALGLKHKGRIKLDVDADLVLIDKQDFAVDTVWSKGQLMVEAGKACKLPTFAS